MTMEKFINYAFKKRVEFLKLLKKDIGKISEKILIEFTRTVAIMITYGPAGLSGSIKMVTFLPKNEYLGYLTKIAEKYAYETRLNLKDKIDILLKEFYVEDRIDFMKIGCLEMAFRHTWTNVRNSRLATLVFFTPPIEAYEVRCRIKVHNNWDYVQRYLNALHDFFHFSGKRSKYPAYECIIEEIYDNSASSEGFGRRIYP